MSNNWRWKYLYTLHSLTMKWFLEVWIALSTLFSMWLLGVTNWYLMLVVVIFIFKALGSSLSMKCRPGLIPRLFKSSVNYVKYRIISLSLLFFVAVFRMVLQSYTYMTYNICFSWLVWWVNVRIGLSKFFFPSFARVHICAKHYIFFLLSSRYASEGFSLVGCIPCPLVSRCPIVVLLGFSNFSLIIFMWGLAKSSGNRILFHWGGLMFLVWKVLHEGTVIVLVYMFGT